LFLLRFIFKNPAISAHFARSRQSPVHHTWIRQILARFTARVLLRPGQRYHVDRHGQLTLKQLRLSVLNEMHTNSYTGPRLLECSLVLYSRYKTCMLKNN
jgi:hypothetical protein